MRLLFIFLLLLTSCFRDVKVPFITKEPAKPINVIIENEFNITYSLLTLENQINDACQMSLEIKNISKDEKRNSLSIEAYSFGNKKYEVFVAEKKSRPNEVVNSIVKFSGILCSDIRIINFYK
jgi:tRNA (Thr-GGU) A37 N-methylase